MIVNFFNWCGRNIETIIWLNIVLLTASALEQAQEHNWYPLGLCAVLVGLVLVLRK